MFFKGHVIFVRVTRTGTTGETPSSKLCIEVKEFISITLSNIIGNLEQSLRFELYIHCPKSEECSVNSLISVADLQGNVDVPCHFHDDNHVILSCEVLRFWFHEEGKEDSLQQQQDMEKNESSVSKKDQYEEVANDNKAGLMKAESDQTEAVFVHEQLVQRAKSVGIIRSTSICGTGFRVGPCYVMTAKHVVDKIMDAASVPLQQQRPQYRQHILGSRNVFIDFDFQMNKLTSDENLRFHFEPRIVYANDELDTVILKLKDNTAGGYPPPLTRFTRSLKQESRGYYFIGHPRADVKKTDKYQCVQLDQQQIIAAKEWSKKLVNKEDFVGIDDPRRVLLHCSFEAGASGAPGFWISPDDGKAYVLLMLLRGYPDWYYDDNYKDKRTGILPTDLIEQGVYMSSIYDDMKRTNPSLCQEIFHFDDEDVEMKPSEHF